MNDNKTCPVCGHEQSKIINDCEQCRWDYPVMLGSGEEVKKELDSRLTAARKKWQLQQRNPDLAPNLNRDPFETADEFKERITSQCWCIGEIVLQKAEYDIDTGKFPVKFKIIKPWVGDLLKGVESYHLNLTADKAKELYGQNAKWPVYAYLNKEQDHFTHEISFVVDHLIIDALGSELKVRFEHEVSLKPDECKTLMEKGGDTEDATNELSKGSYFNKSPGFGYFFSPILLSFFIICLSLFASAILKNVGIWGLVLNPVAWFVLALPAAISWNMIPSMLGSRVFEYGRENLLLVGLKYTHILCYFGVAFWYLMLTFVTAHELLTGSGEGFIELVGMMCALFFIILFYKELNGVFVFLSIKLIVFLLAIVFWLYLFVYFSFPGLDLKDIMNVGGIISVPLLVLLATQELRLVCTKLYHRR